MFTKTFLATAVAGLAAAAPVARQTVQEFAMIATHSASAVHLQSINANGGKFWVGASKPTASFCPLDASQCPAGTSTILATANTGGVSMDVVVPGGQQVYIDGTDSSFSFSSPHAFPPAGAILTPFTYTAPASEGTVGTLSFGTDGQGFFACPTTDVAGPSEGFPYQIFSYAPGVADASCIGINIATTGFTGTGAWEYT